MRCIKTRLASFDASGNITFSPRNAISGLIPISLDCRKCLPCRLKQAREKGVRAWHESKSHEENIFLTLTYNNESLKSPWLDLYDLQKFVQNLRDRLFYESNGLHKISTMYTGEYGELNKRPHWHLIIFNFRPDDQKFARKNERGESLYTSAFIDDIWAKGYSEYGDVTIDSAGYVARYASKKLVHGFDQDHPYQPIHNTPKRLPMGKSWLQNYMEFTFQNGYINLPNGSTCGIPRYYKDYVKKHNPELYLHYVTKVLPDTVRQLEQQAHKEEMAYLQNLWSRSYERRPMKRQDVKYTILKQKFKKLQEQLKL